MLELPKFALLEGVLWYINSARGSRPRIVVPKVLQLELLEETHSGPLVGILLSKVSMTSWQGGIGGEVCIRMYTTTAGDA